MKRIIKISLFTFLITCFTACGGGMSKNNLVGKKWSLDTEALEKEMERIVSKLEGIPFIDQIIKQAIEEQRAELESGTMEFKEDGSIEISEANSSSFVGSSNEAQWNLSGGKLYFSKDGAKLGVRVSGSANKMTLTITKADVVDFFKQIEETLPSETEVILDKIGEINISLKAK